MRGVVVRCAAALPRCRAAALAVGVLVGGCATDGGSTVTGESEAPAAVAPERFDLSFDGEAFAFVESVEAEPITISFTNGCDGIVAAFIVKLNEGVTADDVAEAFESGGEEAAFALFTTAGSTLQTPAGESSEVTIEFPEGSYMVLGEGDELPAAFEVTAATGPAVTPPQADVEVEIGEYFFTFSGDVPTGESTVFLTNVGEQGHEFTGAPGPVDELLASDEEDPEGAFFVVAPAPGGKLWFTNEFEPGINGVFCFFPDAKTGKPHIRLGMKGEFTVA